MSVGFRHWMIVISVLLLASQPVFLAAINHPTMAIALFTRQLSCYPIPPLDEVLNRFFCRTTSIFEHDNPPFDFLTIF
jgi:hypothetical protein